MHPLRKRLVDLFPVADEYWNQIESLITPVDTQKGDFLLRAGDTCHKIYFIEKGLLRFYYLKNGQEFIRQFFFEGGFVTDHVSAFSKIPSRLNIDVLEPGRVHAIPYAFFQETTSFFHHAIYEALFHVSNRMASIFLDTPEEKYLELLSSRPKVIQRIPQYMIASYIGVTPEGLSRIKRRIAKNKSS